ncbi:hypothetical protein ACHAXR_007834 [Thalassiosira sp. AJA248-18]
MADVASYLPQASQALLALALTASAESWRTVQVNRRPSAASDIILSLNRWDTLDFGSIDKILAAKLTDDDLFGVLTCIYAKDRLKTLKLTGCTNFSGRGLEPLMNSTVLQQADLSLVGLHENPEIESDTTLSEAVVLPILHSIIDTNGVSLKYVQLSVRWRSEQSPELKQFLEKYHQCLERRGYKCKKCNSAIDDDDEKKWYDNDIDSPWYGLQNYTCSNCTSIFCHDHSDDPDGAQLRFCYSCERDICISCCVKDMEFCDQCDNGICQECGSISNCTRCHRNVCELCLPTCTNCNITSCVECKPYVFCEGEECDKEHCDDCFDADTKHDVECCQECQKTFCTDCRYSEYSKVRNTCDGEACIAVQQKIISEGVIERTSEISKGATTKELLKAAPKEIQMKTAPATTHAIIVRRSSLLVVWIAVITPAFAQHV